MKTATAILFALCFSSFILSGLAAGQDVSADTLTVTIIDSDTSNTAAFPLAIVSNAGTKSSVTASAGTSAVTGATTYAGNTYTYTFNGGVPMTSTYALSAKATASPNAEDTSGYIIIKLAVGSQVATVSASAGGKATTPTQTYGTTAAFVQGTNVCGDSVWDALNGFITFYLVDACTVTITQVNAVSGVIQYSDASLTGTQTTAIQNSLASTANSATGVSGATAVLPAQGTGSTLQYYVINGLTSATQATNVQQSIQAAIYAKTISSSGATQLNGFAKAIAPNSAAGTAAPSASTTANINNAYPKSHSRMVAIVGVFTTVFAAFFGLAF